MSIQRQPFGSTKDGKPVELFTLRSPDLKIVAKVITFGGHLTELHAPDRNGRVGNVVLGFDNLGAYLAPHDYIGATVGRYANRIANGRFTLDGVEYRLPINNGPNSLHGGTVGFDAVVWNAQPRETKTDASLELTYSDPDGHNGFPGTVNATVAYTVDNKGIRIDYTATTDKPTPINLTNHSYFNLRGPGSGDIDGHFMMIDASHYTPVDDTSIPLGPIAPVDRTVFDFTIPKLIGDRINDVPGGGYDHNYCLDTAGDLNRLAARVHEPTTGRAMEVFTTEPGVQFYTGNFLSGAMGIGGAYKKHGAFCLETQHYPDSPNKPQFPSTILRPGQMYRTTTIYRFSTDAE